MRPRKGIGLFLAISMALSVVAITPGRAAAVTYSRDGGNPASCPTPYTVLSSLTKNLSVGGYIKVEMVYCPAWSVVWTRAYNYTGRTAWMATGMLRTENGTLSKQYDYANGTCGTFCIDSLASGSRGFGYQLYWPSSVGNVTFTATAYYCTTNSPSACSSANKVQTTGSPVGVKIANLANANVGLGPCGLNSLGSYGFASPTGSSCPNGPYGAQVTGAWCDEFAGWVWWNADSHIDVSGLGAGPIGFRDYSTLQPLSATAHLGDAVVMATLGDSIPAHVGIVTLIDATGRVTIVSGNEAGQVRESYYTPGAATRVAYDGTNYRVVGYVSPRLH